MFLLKYLIVYLSITKNINIYKYMIIYKINKYCKYSILLKLFINYYIDFYEFQSVYNKFEDL